MHRKFHINKWERIEGSKINAEVIRMSEISVKEQIYNEQKQIEKTIWKFNICQKNL